jgi:hypothetical protein
MKFIKEKLNITPENLINENCNKNVKFYVYNSNLLNLVIQFICKLAAKI